MNCFVLLDCRSGTGVFVKCLCYTLDVIQKIGKKNEIKSWCFYSVSSNKVQQCILILSEQRTNGNLWIDLSHKTRKQFNSGANDKTKKKKKKKQFKKSSSRSLNSSESMMHILLLFWSWTAAPVLCSIWTVYFVNISMCSFSPFSLTLIMHWLPID